tara:strand:+ start:140 stop:310 length:171 start_codon:yes stop_codon:yes gene_type:complete
MKFFVQSRKRKHRKYLETRIHELHQQLFRQVIDDGKIDHFTRKLLLKYHQKLKTLK